MLKLLRKLTRSLQRLALILRTQGARGLYLSLKRQLTAARPSLKREYRLLDLSEPFAPLDFPDCPSPRVSVVIPMRDDVRSTHHCLAALLDQGGSHSYEVILVGAHSPDDGRERRPHWGQVRFVSGPGRSETAIACNLGAAAGRGEILVFLDDHAQVQADWLDGLVATFAHRVDAGTVCGRVLSPDGRQRSAGGTLLEDGETRANGYLDDPCRPEYGYLRVVDYCDKTSLAVRRDLFLDLKGFDAALAASCYAEIDFALRAKQAGYLTYCQPVSEVVLFGEEPGAAEADRSDVAEAREPQHREFLRRWETTLSAARSLGSDTKPGGGKHAFVVDYALPAPDRESGSFRLVNLLSILQEEGFAITFASMGLEARQPYLSDLQRQGIECLYRPYEDSIQEHLRRMGARYDLVILCRVATAAELMRSARRWCPRAMIVFDTVDLHFQRLAGEAAVRRDAGMERLAARVKRQELDLIAKADTTFVVSTAEKALLSVEAPGADVRIVSNIHPLPGSARRFEERSDILFVGGFAHPPNRDAVLFFCEEVFPRVCAVLPGVRFLVIGSDPPVEVTRLNSDRVQILGYVPDMDPYLDNCRMSVAPLRFGAGVKGKINQSLAYGLPVVATSVAAEGMFLVDGESALIADDTRGLADAVVRLYGDEDLWNRLSRGGLAVMEEHFSIASARKALIELLASK